MHILGSWNMTTTSSTDTWTSGNRGYATRRVRALGEGKYRSLFLRHHLALRLQSWRGYSLGISQRPRRGSQGIRCCSLESPGGVRNILRDGPSILNTSKSAIMIKVIAAEVNRNKVPGSCTESMIWSEWVNKRLGEGGKEGKWEGPEQSLLGK